MRKTLLCLLALVLAVGVFFAARHLDKSPLDHGYEAREPLQLEGYEPVLNTEPAAEETGTAATEAAPEQTEATEATGETEAGETAPEETGSQETEATQAPEETEPVETVPPYTGPGGETYVLTFVGDCTLGANPIYEYSGYGFLKTVGEDYDYPLANVKSYFENDDLTLVNLEGILGEGGKPVGQNVFRGAPDYVNILTQNSVDMVSLANNHTQDYGAEGYSQTEETLKDAGIPYVERDSSTIITTESGLTIGIYGSVYYYVDEDVVKEEISKLRRQGVDLVIYAPHWGSDNSYKTTAEQVKLAHIAIDAGADIVYGTHPHVLQPIEEYNGGIIYYSLGDFCFGGNIYPNDYDTVLLQQEIIREEDGSVTLGELTVVPVCMSSVKNRNNFQPTPYEAGSEEYARVLNRLNVAIG